MAAQHRGEAEEILLLEVVMRRVVAARARHLHPEERLRHDLRLLRHRHVVLRRHSEAARASVMDAALHHHELRGEAVHRAVVGEGLVDPPTERAGVVQHRLQDPRVLREHVLPIADPVVGPRRTRQEPVDGARATVRTLVGRERGRFRPGGDHSGQVEGRATEEGRVVRQRGGFYPGLFQLRPDETVDGVEHRGAGGHIGNPDRRQSGDVFACPLMTALPVAFLFPGGFMATHDVGPPPRVRPLRDEAPELVFRQADAVAFKRGEQPEIIGTNRRRGHAHFAQLGTAGLQAHDGFQGERVRFPVGDEVRHALEMSGPQVTEMRREGQGRVRHLFVPVGLEVREPRGEHLLGVDEKPGTRARPEQQPMPAGRKRDRGGGAVEERHSTVHLHAARRITRRHVGESERTFVIRLCRRARRELPARLVGNALDDFDADGTDGAFGTG